MHAFEKNRGLVIRDWYLVGGWRRSVQKRKVTKERDVEILLKNTMNRSCYGTNKVLDVKPLVPLLIRVCK